MSVIVHKDNVTQTDDHQFPCELFQIYSYGPKQNRSTAGFQTFDTGPFILSLKRTTKKSASTKDHVAKIFNLFVPDCTKRAYILKQTCS